MVAKDEREDSRVVYFVDTLFDIIDVHDDKKDVLQKTYGLEIYRQLYFNV